MLWLPFRQFRTQAVLAAGALVALAVVVVIVGSQVLEYYHAAVGACAGADEFVDKYQQKGQWLSALVLVVPGLIGVFWDAPLFARELESGTFRLAWTQSISRARWTLCKLGPSGWRRPACAACWSRGGPVPSISPSASGPSCTSTPAASCRCAMSPSRSPSGMAAGAVVRRTVAAMGATLVSFAAVRLAFTEWVRPHLMAPLVSRRPFSTNSLKGIEIGAHLPRRAWVVSESLVDAAGHVVGTGGRGLLDLSTAVVVPAGVSLPGIGTCANIRPSAAQPGDSQSISGLVARCVNQPHRTDVVTYQPTKPLLALQGRHGHLLRGRAGGRRPQRLVSTPPHRLSTGPPRTARGRPQCWWRGHQ